MNEAGTAPVLNTYIHLKVVLPSTRETIMTYYTDLFSPETYEAFSRSGRDISGFSPQQRTIANKVRVGDKLICYLTKLSRWVGVLEVVSKLFEDSTPIFYEEDDPFVLRLKVKPLVWLDKEKAIPVREDKVWHTLTFTRGHDKNSSAWTGVVRSSLRKLDEQDGAYLESVLLEQQAGGVRYPVGAEEYSKLLKHRVRTLNRVVTVTVPEDTDTEEGDDELIKPQEIRESAKLQALLTRMGARMGLKIWVPRNNRSAVQTELGTDAPPLLEVLPLNYDQTTLRTIEEIDVLWLRGRAIVRAFEVEHTTSVYSGLLRMADLLALQPNMAIKLHIVAPAERRDKVFRELQRPVFSLLEKGPLSESCTFLSYDSVRELSGLKHLAYTTDKVLDEYAEVAE